MKHILQGFTMFAAGSDFGYDTEEITIPIPTPLTQDYRGGAMVLGVSQPMSAIEPLEVTVKMSGHNPDVMGLMGRAPGQVVNVTFRGAVLIEADGAYAPHIVNVRGAVNAGSRDTWQRGEKSGLEFIMNGIVYFRYDVADRTIHEVSAWPPILIVNGVNQLAQINAILGY